MSNEAVQVLYGVLAGFKLRPDHVVDATPSLRAAIHGFGLTRDVTSSYDILIGSLIAGLQADQLPRRRPEASCRNVGLSRPVRTFNARSR